jgi:putative membrane protein
MLSASLRVPLMMQREIMERFAKYARAAALVGLLSLCGGIIPAQVGDLAIGQHSQTPTPPQVPVNNPDSASKLDRKKTSQDRKFIKVALEQGLGEVQLGQLALEKGSTQPVKQFGSRMVDDYTKMNDELVQIAQPLGVRVSVRMTKNDRKTLKKLSKLSGTAFDHAYISSMVQDHISHLRVFQAEAASGQDPVAKDVALRGSRTINDQLQVAQQMAMNRKIDVTGR